MGKTSPPHIRRPIAQLGRFPSNSMYRRITKTCFLRWHLSLSKDDTCCKLRDNLQSKVARPLHESIRFLSKRGASLLPLWVFSANLCNGSPRLIKSTNIKRLPNNRAALLCHFAFARLSQYTNSKIYIFQKRSHIIRYTDK